MTTEKTAQSMLERFISLVPCTDFESKEVYRIGDIARHFGVTLRTLRFYEDRGLIMPKRVGATRLYTPEDRLRIKLILLAKGIGFSLVDIQELLKIYDEENTGESDEEIILQKFKQQLSKLQSQKTEVEKSISNLTDAIELITE